MNAGLPLVTIITPAYNRAAFLDETVDSVLSQDYPNIEYIVLDDGSKDNTKEVMEKYGGRVIFESHANMGETRTVNKAFEMAHGGIICVVNSDDPLKAGAVAAGVRALQASPDALAAYPDWDEIGPDSVVTKHMQLPDYDIENMLAGFNVATGPGVFIRRSAIERFGMRDPQFRYVGDLEFWFRLALHGKIVHIPQILATHRVHPDAASITDQGSRMADELVQMVHKVYSFKDIPPHIRQIRRQVLSKAHYVATYYCGSDSNSVKHHMMLHYWYAPQKLVLGLLESVYGGLRRIWSKVKSKFS
jgi:glycosyltransferase involved in cell wall biosynthesis